LSPHRSLCWRPRAGSLSTENLDGWDRLFEHRVTRSAFGALVFGLTLSAFLAPAFSGRDTVPSLDVVVIGLGVLMRDLLVALVGALLGAIGVATILVIGNLEVETAKQLL
jgi:hypothetical protein